MDQLVGKKIDRGTFFRDGYPLGYYATEIRDIQIYKVFDDKLAFKYMLVFKEKRKQQIHWQRIDGSVLVEGWGLKGLKEWEDGRMVPKGNPNWTTQRFDHEEGYRQAGWNKYLEEFLKRQENKLIADGRSLKSEGLNQAFNPKWYSDGLDTYEIQTRKRVLDFKPLEVEAETFIEGTPLLDIITRYERDVHARAACLAHHGYRCQVCDKTMEEIYGPIGKDFIHVHHLKPLSEIREEYVVDPIRDLVPVCPNCHAMLHRKSQVLSIEELRSMVHMVT